VPELFLILKKKTETLLCGCRTTKRFYYRRLAETESNFFKSSYYQARKPLAGEIPAYPSEINPVRCRIATGYRPVPASVRPSAYCVNTLLYALAGSQAVAGQGNLCMYHGNLNVAENKKAALWLIQRVFSQLNVPFCIAGKNIPESLMRAAKDLNHVSFYQQSG
jgi:hypothetical protein